MMKKSLMIGSTLAATVAITFAGCSSAPSSNGQTQSVESACEIIYEGLVELETELSEVSGSGSTEDLHAMVAVAEKHLDALDQEVTNPEVKDLWDPIAQLQREGLQAAANEDQEGLMGTYLEMSEKYEEFAKVCPSVPSR